MMIRESGIVLFTEHYEKAVEFYQAVLKLEIRERKDKLTIFNFGKSYLMVEDKGFASPVEKDRKMNPTVLRLDILDFEDTISSIRAMDIKITVDTYSWGRIGILLDTEGNRIELKDVSYK